MFVSLYSFLSSLQNERKHCANRFRESNPRARWYFQQCIPHFGPEIISTKRSVLTEFGQSVSTLGRICPGIAFKFGALESW